MKKLVLYIFLGLICFKTSYASDSLKGLQTFVLGIEKIDNTICRISTKDIEREVKFVLSSTPIKLTKETGAEIIYIAPTIINTSAGCSGFILFEVWKAAHLKNSVGNKYIGREILYDKGRLHVNVISKFSDAYLKEVSKITKDFVIKWKEVN